MCPADALHAISRPTDTPSRPTDIISRHSDTAARPTDAISTVSCLSGTAVRHQHQPRLAPQRRASPTLRSLVVQRRVTRLPPGLPALNSAVFVPRRCSVRPHTMTIVVSPRVVVSPRRCPTPWRRDLNAIAPDGVSALWQPTDAAPRLSDATLHPSDAGSCPSDGLLAPPARATVLPSPARLSITIATPSRLSHAARLSNAVRLSNAAHASNAVSTASRCPRHSRPSDAACPVPPSAPCSIVFAVRPALFVSRSALPHSARACAVSCPCHVAPRAVSSWRCTGPSVRCAAPCHALSCPATHSSCPVGLSCPPPRGLRALLHRLQPCSAAPHSVLSIPSVPSHALWRPLLPSPILSHSVPPSVFARTPSRMPLVAARFSCAGFHAPPSGASVSVHRSLVLTALLARAAACVWHCIVAHHAL
ncbi:hypothetical protein DENSPDRAFT_887387 [Dentipellis sp. KUC8613]|nr:hypothetical protein DENSPDRAFT_887387 [Dentipellis sp. KUC8613]